MNPRDSIGISPAVLGPERCSEYSSLPQETKKAGRGLTHGESPNVWGSKAHRMICGCLFALSLDMTVIWAIRTVLDSVSRRHHSDEGAFALHS